MLSSSSVKIGAVNYGKGGNLLLTRNNAFAMACGVKHTTDHTLDRGYSAAALVRTAIEIRPRPRVLTANLFSKS